MFRHPDGRCRIASPLGGCRELIGPYPWQIAQVGPTQFEVRYQAGEGAQPADPGKFIERFREFLFEDAAIEFKQVPGFAAPAGKIRLEYVNEWNARPGQAPLINSASGLKS